MTTAANTLDYPPKPKTTGRFQHKYYSYEYPVTVHKWAWSTTFGRWSALVTFADGWEGYTYPEPWKSVEDYQTEAFFWEDCLVDDVERFLLRETIKIFS